VCVCGYVCIYIYIYLRRHGLAGRTELSLLDQNINKEIPLRYPLRYPPDSGNAHSKLLSQVRLFPPRFSQVLQSFSSTDFNEAGKVQDKANDVMEMLDDGAALQKRRREMADSFSGSMGKYGGFSSENAPRPKASASNAAAAVVRSPGATSRAQEAEERWNAPDDGFGAAFDSIKDAPAAEVNLFDVDGPAPTPVSAPATPAATAAAPSGLSANIGSIKVNINREGKERSRPVGGGLSLGRLPTPAAAGGFAAPAPAASEDIFGLMESPAVAPYAAPHAAPPPAVMGSADDLFGMMDSGGGGGAVMGMGGGASDAGADFGDFDSAAPAAPQKSAAESMLESALTGLTVAPAPVAAAPAVKGRMGPGSGLGMSAIPTMQAQPPRSSPMGGMGGQQMGGMRMPQQQMGGMGMQQPGQMGGMGGSQQQMGGMGMQRPGGQQQMGGMGMQQPGQMGGMGMQQPGQMGGMGMQQTGAQQQMGGMGMQQMGGMGSGQSGYGMPMGGGMGGGMAPAPAAAAPRAPDPFANLMG